MDVSSESGAIFAEKWAARGLAVGDIDNDGTLEVLVNNQNEPPSLWKQAGRAAGHWLLIALSGSRSNRSAIGARVMVSAAGRVQTDELHSGGSYLSQNDMRLHFGLGSATRADSITVRWPSGEKTVLKDVASDRVVTIRQTRD